jgi:glycosyltransferase involved in cell wall biosynthesis
LLGGTRDDGRPIAFLISAPGCARDVAGNMGNADYSYTFVLKALAPVLERFGRWQLIANPESSLLYQARRAEAEGYRPVQLAIQPPPQCYFTPAVPTIVFPFWEFPDLPDRDFAHDTRQNWVRMLRHADLVVTACQFTAEAIERSGIDRPVAVVPVPLAPDRFEVPDWDPGWTWNIDCRYTELARGGRVAAPEPAAAGPPPPRKPLWYRAARRAYHSARLFYNHRILRWLSPEAVERLFQLKNKLRKRAKIGPPVLPRASLNLSGLVYTSVFNLGDRRKNLGDLLTSFLLAFRDRPDVTLVLKLATNPAREFHELKELRARYGHIGIDHKCRVVVITDFLSDDQMNDLYRATTYYLNTSHAEGACLPLQEALAAGRPVIAPRHTAMLDYIDDRVAFVAASHAEPTIFPQDPEPKFDTVWNRLVWADLRAKLHDSARVAEETPDLYQTMAAAGRGRMRDLFGQEAASEALAMALDRLPASARRDVLAWTI